jgi:hypothetical protein
MEFYRERTLFGEGLDTVGCTSFEMLAAPGVREPSHSYSQQYDHQSVADRSEGIERLAQSGT